MSPTDLSLMGRFTPAPEPEEAMSENNDETPTPASPATPDAGREALNAYEAAWKRMSHTLAMTGTTTQEDISAMGSAHRLAHDALAADAVERERESCRLYDELARLAGVQVHDHATNEDIVRRAIANLGSLRNTMMNLTRGDAVPPLIGVWCVHAYRAGYSDCRIDAVAAVDAGGKLNGRTPNETMLRAPAPPAPGQASPDASATGLREAVANAKHWERSFYEMQRMANGLYDTIVRRLQPYFPKGTRDLEWDILPSTVEGLAKRVALSAPAQPADAPAPDPAGGELKRVSPCPCCGRTFPGQGGSFFGPRCDMGNACCTAPAAPGTPGKGEECCGEKDGTGFACTLNRGHTGPHVADGIITPALKTWDSLAPQSPAADGDH